MNVLSLFDGISCCRLALDKAEIKVEKYYRAEIDKYANIVADANYPNSINLGDVTRWQEWGIDWSAIDLVTAGFPCQSWSVAGHQMGDKDPRGALFWTTLDIIKKVINSNPKAKWLMENVRMKSEFEQYITHHTKEALGDVNKVLINSALVSAQNRKRFYWSNFKINTNIKDMGLKLADVLQNDFHSDFVLNDTQMNYMQRERNGKPRFAYHKSNLDGKSCTLTANMYKGVPYGVIADNREFLNKTITSCGKAYTLTASQGNCVAWNSAERKQRSMAVVGLSSELNPNVVDGVLYRKLTPIECERLQTIPDNYTNHASKSQRYKMIGNAWTVDVIAHIFKCM